MKVLISTAGIGQRLGELTRHTNKSLVPVGDKPCISRIIDSYPKDFEFVVSLGHFGGHVRNYLALAHPERIISFVEVENYRGPGSSLALSISGARDFLQCPFFFHAGDTIVEMPDNAFLGGNWLAVSDGEDSSLYASLDVMGSEVMKIKPKGSDDYDYLYVGVASVESFEDFWRSASELSLSTKTNTEANDLSIIGPMIQSGVNFQARKVSTWNDVGSVGGLRKAQETFSSTIATLPKRDQGVFRVGGKILKFNSDEISSSEAVARAQILQPHVPRVVASLPNWFSYEYVDGRVGSHHPTAEMLTRLLDWAQNSFWSERPDSIDSTVFKNACEDFYIKKSLDRIRLFSELSGTADVSGTINGVNVPSAAQLVESFREVETITGKASGYHGDFVLDNVLVTEEGFLAIDWRQNFGGLLEYGDLYYDLAKLNHSLTMSHDFLNGGNFEVQPDGQDIWIDLHRRESLVELTDSFHKFVKRQGYALSRINRLTALIWINMAALHPHPMNVFLFHFGRLSLWRRLNRS